MCFCTRPTHGTLGTHIKCSCVAFRRAHCISSAPLLTLRLNQKQNLPKSRKFTSPQENKNPTQKQEVHEAPLQDAVDAHHLRQTLLREGYRDRFHGHPVDAGLLSVLDQRHEGAWTDSGGDVGVSCCGVHGVNMFE